MLALAACQRAPSAGVAEREPAAPDAGTRAEGRDWAVSLEGPAAAGAGQPVRVRVAAKGGFHVNLEYPTAFLPVADATADLGGARIDLSGALEKKPCAARPAETCEASAAIPFVARGTSRLSGYLAFSVCDPKVCLIEKVPLAISVAAR